MMDVKEDIDETLVTEDQWTEEYTGSKGQYKRALNIS